MATIEKKKSGTTDLTVGKPLFQILRFALPLVLGTLFQQLYSFADTVIVGRCLGTDALGAVGTTYSLNFLILGFVQGACVGFGIPAAETFGAKDKGGLQKYLLNGALLCLVLSAVFTVFTTLMAGMMLCPEDRKAEGIIPVHSVRDNINISARRKHIHAGCLINNAWEADNADQHIQSLNIKTPGPEQLIMNLSGGNQQKAILGRWLSEEMKVILLDEPTRGIDVGAKHEIYNVIYGLAASGVAVVFASSDLPEVLGVADRIVVMREGQIAGELLHEEANEQQALSLAMPTVSQAVA